MANVARGEMRIVGETTFDCEPAYELAYNNGSMEGTTVRIEVATYEVPPVTAATLAKLKVKKARR